MKEKPMQKELNEIELLDTENQSKPLSDYFKEKEFTLVLSYRGDW
jgi:hypothetical protein